MSSSKIGLVKITCHESLHSSHDVQFLHKAAAPPTMLHSQQTNNILASLPRIKPSDFRPEIHRQGSSYGRIVEELFIVHPTSTPTVAGAMCVSPTAAAVKSVQLAEEEKICSCQVRFMSGPDHFQYVAACNVVVDVVAHMHASPQSQRSRLLLTPHSEVNVS